MCSSATEKFANSIFVSVTACFKTACTEPILTASNTPASNFPYQEQKFQSKIPRGNRLRP